MKQSIAQIIESTVRSIPELAALPELQTIAAVVERTRDSKHGDFATSIAMQLAKPARRNPRELAQLVVDHLPATPLIDKVEIAGPGFINFYIGAGAFHEELLHVLDQGADYGTQTCRESPRYLLEFVSANPTGPLHVGHGRHASFGASVGSLMRAAGYAVDLEYYVNDAGRQMDILGASVFLRLLQSRGEDVAIPAAGYRGDYIRDIAAQIKGVEVGDITAAALLQGLPADEAQGGDKEAYITAVIDRAQALLGTEAFASLRQQSLSLIRDEIREDLLEFGVRFDNWYSEQSLEANDLIDKALDVLRERGMLYKQDGATWFRSSDFGDEKDRVVIRENGKKTYFASDIAYHLDKRQRGYDHLIDVLGADHHGYVARVRAGLQAFGYAGDSFEVPLIQFVSLYRSGEKVAMSTRSGDFVTLRQLREEVGNDAARFFFVMRSNDQHLDFDLELAKSRSNDNPVYYIQYAHARVASVFRQLAEKSLAWDRAQARTGLALLTAEHEKTLMATMSRFPEVIDLAARNRAPQHLVHYLRDLANDFHTYYNAHVFLVDDPALRNARLLLIEATRQVVANGLGILGVSAPESM